MQGYYPEVNLHSIRFAQGINTVHGQAITIGNDIFIPGAVKLDNRRDLKLIFHEIEHTVQYARRGGVRPFLAEYIAKIPAKIVQRGSLEVHDDIDLERDAIGKSLEVVNAFYGWDLRLANNCSHPVSIAVDYKDGDDWTTDGYWTATPGQQFLLGGEESGTLHSKNGVYYFYAESTDNSNLKWQGYLNKTVPSDKRTLGFTKLQMTNTNDDTLDINLSCP